MNRLKQKLKSRAGETLAETLVSLLIAALALVMLAGAMTTASSVVERGRKQLDRYYSANEAENGVIYMEATGESGSVTLSSTDLTLNIPVVYYENSEFAKTPVVAYKVQQSAGD